MFFKMDNDFKSKMNEYMNLNIYYNPEDKNFNIISTIHEITNFLIDGFGMETFESLGDTSPREMIRSQIKQYVLGEMEYFLHAHQKLYSYVNLICCKLEKMKIENNLPILVIINKITKHILFYDNIKDFENNMETLSSDIIREMDEINNMDESNSNVQKFLQILKRLEDFSEDLNRLYKEDKVNFLNKLGPTMQKLQRTHPKISLFKFYKHCDIIFQAMTDTN
jgi:hypothetical protein